MGCAAAWWPAGLAARLLVLSPRVWLLAHKHAARKMLALEELAAAKALASFDFCSFGACGQKQERKEHPSK